MEGVLQRPLISTHSYFSLRWGSILKLTVRLLLLVLFLFIIVYYFDFVLFLLVVVLFYYLGKEIGVVSPVLFLIRALVCP